MPRRKRKPPCSCELLDSSLDEDEMPKAVLASFERLTDGMEYHARCPVCGQHWFFLFRGREDIPTFQKLDTHSARLRIAAWIEAQPERAARAAQQEQEARDRAAAYEMEYEKQLQAEARAKEPLSIIIQYAALLLIGGATLMGFKFIITGSDPDSQQLAILSGALVAGIALAGVFAWRTRVR